MSETQSPPVALRACKGGNTISQVDANDKRYEQCIVCGLSLPWDRNMHFLAGFAINCPKGDDGER